MIRNELIAVAFTGLLVTAGGVARAEDAATNMNDQQITEQVKQKLAADDPAVASRILVSTRDGVVTLMGQELTPADIQTVMHDAEHTSGVIRVDNLLKLG